MRFIIFMTLLVMGSYGSAAVPLSSAKIVAMNFENVAVTIEVGNDGVPRVADGSGQSVSIKDFREGATFDPFCFEGADQPVRELLESLVNAANGDGDSWAETDELKRVGRDYEVTALITDERGQRREHFIFSPCN